MSSERCSRSMLLRSDIILLKNKSISYIVMGIKTTLSLSLNLSNTADSKTPAGSYVTHLRTCGNTPSADHRTNSPVETLLSCELQCTETRTALRSAVQHAQTNVCEPAATLASYQAGFAWVLGKRQVLVLSVSTLRTHYVTGPPICEPARCFAASAKQQSCR